jgi:hypothetical protein
MLSGLKYKLISCFNLVADKVGGGIWKFVNDTDRPAFLVCYILSLQHLSSRIHFLEEIGLFILLDGMPLS